MPLPKSDPNSGIFEYALRRLEKERDEILSRIDHIRKELGGWISGPVAAPAPAAFTPAAAAAVEAAPRKKRVLSAAARKKIAAAQKLRWAKVREAKGGKGSKAAK